MGTPHGAMLVTAAVGSPSRPSPLMTVAASMPSVVRGTGGGEGLWAVVLMCSAGGLSFRLDSWRDGWHAWPQAHSWPGLQGDVDAAFSWDKRMYLIQVGPPLGWCCLGTSPGTGPLGCHRQEKGRGWWHSSVPPWLCCSWPVCVPGTSSPCQKWPHPGAAPQH